MIDLSRPISINLFKQASFVTLLAVVLVSQFGNLKIVDAIANKKNEIANSLQQHKSGRSPEMTAFLDTIAWAETGTFGEAGYKSLVFSGNSADYSRHPGTKQCGTIRGKRICSTAAGRYQFLHSTWKGLVVKLKLKDFSPESQDLAAIELIRQSGAIEFVEAGKFAQAACLVGKVWASIPCGNSYNQSRKSMSELKRVYLQRLSEGR